MQYLGYTLGDDSIPMAPPTPDMMAKMGVFAEDLTSRGKIIATGGFTPIATGTVKVNYIDGEFTVTDGPFTEAKELIGGWALIEVDSQEEAIEQTKQFLSIVGGGETTLRRIMGPEDFGPAFADAAAASQAASAS